MTKIKVLFLCLILTFVISGAQAQNTFHPEWAIGGSSGVNFSSVSFSPKVQESMLMGFNGGATIRWNTEKNLGVQMELNFKQQGWKELFEKTDDSTLDYHYIRRMNYVEIPFFTHIYFGGDKVKFFVNLGPQIGFLLSESTDENLNGATIPKQPNAQHTMPVQKKFEWGLRGGAGLEFRTRIGYFLLEGRYYYALSDFYQTRHQDAFSKASSQVISTKLTYLVPFH